MDIQERTFTQLRDRMDEIVLEASRGDIFMLTKVNRRTGAALVPAALVDDEEFIVELLFKVAPGRLATDQEIAAR